MAGAGSSQAAAATLVDTPQHHASTPDSPAHPHLLGQGLRGARELLVKQRAPERVLRGQVAQLAAGAAQRRQVARLRAGG